MKETGVKTSSKGMGLAGVLTVVFIVLKLLNVIDWPWVWVLAPLWISFIITVIFIIGCLIATKIMK